MRRELSASILVLSLVSGVQAHDYWLQPETFFPAAEAKVAVRLLVGDDFITELERPFQKKPTLRFELVSKTKSLNLAATSQEGPNRWRKSPSPQRGRTG